MQVIEQAHQKLLELTDSVNSSSAEYTDKLQAVANSLKDTKASIKKDYKSMNKSEQKLGEIDVAITNSVKTNA